VKNIILIVLLILILAGCISIKKSINSNENNVYTFNEIDIEPIELTDSLVIGEMDFDIKSLLGNKIENGNMDKRFKVEITETSSGKKIYADSFGTHNYFAYKNLKTEEYTLTKVICNYSYNGAMRKYEILPKKNIVFGPVEGTAFTLGRIEYSINGKDGNINAFINYIPNYTKIDFLKEYKDSKWKDRYWH